MGIISNIKKGWEQARDMKSPEGFAKNLQSVYDSLDSEEAISRTLATRSGEEYDDDPIKDWDRKISALMTNNDPRIQKLGVDLMDDQYRTETAQAGQSVPNSFKEYQLATPPEGQTPESYGKWLENRSTQRVMNVQDPRAPVPLNELRNMVDVNGNPMSFPVGTTWDEVKSQGSRVGGAKLTAEEGRRESQFAVATKDLNELGELMNLGADLSGVAGAVKSVRQEGGFTGSLVDAGLNFMGYDNVTPQDAQALGLISSIENSVVAAFRGAAVGPEEIKRFIRQLPVAGMPMDQFMFNLDKTLENLAYVEQENNTRSGRGGGGDNGMTESTIQSLMKYNYTNPAPWEPDLGGGSEDINALVPQKLLQQTLPVGARRAEGDVDFGNGGI